MCNCCKKGYKVYVSHILLTNIYDIRKYTTIYDIRKPYTAQIDTVSKQLDAEASRHSERQISGEIHGHIDRQMIKYANGYTDGQSQ